MKRSILVLALAAAAAFSAECTSKPSSPAPPSPTAPPPTPTPAPASIYSVSGAVTDASDEGLVPAVLVEALSGNTVRAHQTTYNGKYKLSQLGGDLQIRVSA